MDNSTRLNEGVEIFLEKSGSSLMQAYVDYRLIHKVMANWPEVQQV